MRIVDPSITIRITSYFELAPSIERVVPVSRMDQDPSPRETVVQPIVTKKKILSGFRVHSAQPRQIVHVFLFRCYIFDCDTTKDFALCSKTKFLFWVFSSIHPFIHSLSTNTSASFIIIMSVPAKNSMDRGSNALKSHCNGLEKMEIRQTRRGWCQELLGCDAKTEFKYFVGNDQIATSIEDTDCCCRMFCNPIHPFKMVVKELNTEAEMVSVDRPCACQQGPCKCCCYQTATFTSGGQDIGKIEEKCYCW